MQDLDRIFDDVGNAAFYMSKNMMDPSLSNVSQERKIELVNNYRKGSDPLTMASLWFSLFRSDQRPAIEKNICSFFMYYARNAIIFNGGC